jgi:hypothetical protein
LAEAPGHELQLTIGDRAYEQDGSRRFGRISSEIRHFQIVAKELVPCWLFPSGPAYKKSDIVVDGRSVGSHERPSGPKYVPFRGLVLVDAVCYCRVWRAHRGLQQYGVKVDQYSGAAAAIVACGLGLAVLRVARLGGLVLSHVIILMCSVLGSIRKRTGSRTAAYSTWNSRVPQRELLGYRLLA